MKKNIVKAFLVIIIVILVFWLINESHQNLAPAVKTNETVVRTNVRNYLPAIPNPPPIIISQQTNELVSKNETPELVVSNYETLDDLKQIKSLKLLNNLSKLQDWDSDGHLLQFQIKGRDGKSVGMKVIFFTALTDKADNHVRQLTLNSPEMKIDEIRKMGLQLEEAWGLDPTEFLAWCDKVGNKWLDAPLYSSRAGTPPSPNKLIGFGVHSGLNNEKPWYIIISIQDGP